MLYESERILLDKYFLVRFGSIDLKSIDAMIEAAVFNLPDNRDSKIDAVGFTVDYDEEG